MTRIPFSSSAFAVIGFFVLAAPPASLAGQGVRQRGTASAEGQAVPRSEVRRGGEGQAPPAAQAVPRAVPRAAMPQVRVPQVVQPQVNTLRPNDRPDNRPNYQPDNRPNYRPDNRPNYRPDNQPNYRPDNQSNYRPNNQPNYRPEQSAQLPT